MLTEREKHLVGLFSGMAGSWRDTAAFQVFYSCAVGTSRENIPWCRSRNLTALGSSECREELFVCLGGFVCFLVCFSFQELRMQVDELLVVPLRI